MTFTKLSCKLQAASCKLQDIKKFVSLLNLRHPVVVMMFLSQTAMSLFAVTILWLLMSISMLPSSQEHQIRTKRSLPTTVDCRHPN